MTEFTLKRCALFATALLMVGSALAQPWPNRVVRIVVPFPPGGGLDFFARTIAPRLQENLGQQVVVENRSGAGGMIGADAVAKAPPDGYTLLLASSAEITINQHLYPKIAYDSTRDFAPVSYASHAAMLFSVHPSLPAQSVNDVVALARARPGGLSFASAGTGGVQHLAGELLKAAAKIDIVHIPYKGAGPAVIDMVGGQVSMGFTALPSSIQHARSGKLRPIAVTSAKRSEAAPELPTFTELGYPAIDLVVWYGALYPAGTPAAIVERMSAEINRTVQAADVKAKLLQQGVESIGTTPGEFAKFMQSEILRYGRIIKDSGAKAD
ncbi:MAG: tripartite tricarboxylate transporter substrate binding protein [Betaproteobacteria bacterium]|nr:tripartite tricarboxylate transporter substrate binding protein [Betaproteobacteria bacterium]